MKNFKQDDHIFFPILPVMVPLIVIQLITPQYSIAFAPTQDQSPDNPPTSNPNQLPQSSSETSGNASAGTNEPSSELTFENSSAGIKVSYPSDWKSFGSYHDEFIDIIASFEAPVDKHGRPNVNIVSKSLQGYDNLEDYANAYFKNEEKNIQGFKIEELDTVGIMISGKPGYKAVISYNICVVQDCGDEERKGKELHVGTINERGQIIEFNFDSYESEYSKYLPIAQKMLNSLEIK